MRQLLLDVANGIFRGKDTPFNFGLWAGLTFGFAAYALDLFWIFPAVALLPIMVEIDMAIGRRKKK